MAVSSVKTVTAGTIAALPSVACRTVSILNTSGAALTITINSETLSLPDGKSVLLEVNANAKEVSVTGSGDIQVVCN